MKIPENFNFNNSDIVKNFDSHVRSQLPWYDLILDAIEHIVINYLPNDGLIYDIGSATGNTSLKIANIVSSRNAELISIDASKKMIDSFKGKNKCVLSKAEDFKYKKHDISILFLTFMFIPVSKRRSFLSKLKKKVNTGGCIILVDKCIPEKGYQAIVNTRMTIKEKIKNETAEDILKKELSLSGIQRPIDKELFENNMEFFRFGDFAGWVIEK
jgi:tRNA (cmo5U34)-methyltransferase